jgi:hypothetical protein
MNATMELSHLARRLITRAFFMVLRYHGSATLVSHDLYSSLSRVVILDAATTESTRPENFTINMKLAVFGLFAVQTGLTSAKLRAPTLAKKNTPPAAGSNFKFKFEGKEEDIPYLHIVSEEELKQRRRLDSLPTSVTKGTNFQIRHDDDDGIFEVTNGHVISYTANDDGLCTGKNCYGIYIAEVAGKPSIVENLDLCSVLVADFAGFEHFYQVSCASPTYEIDPEIIACEDFGEDLCKDEFKGTVVDDDVARPRFQTSGYYTEALFNRDTSPLPPGVTESRIVYTVEFTCCPTADKALPFEETGGDV